MNALEILQADHDKVNATFERFKQGETPSVAGTLFEQLYKDLTLHTAVEELVFYPEAAKFAETAAIIKRGYQEQGQAKAALTELAGLEVTSEAWSQKMATFIHDIQAHVKEEEGELFPKLRQLMTEAELEELGRKMQEFKMMGLTESKDPQPTLWTSASETQFAQLEV